MVILISLFSISFYVNAQKMAKPTDSLLNNSKKNVPVAINDLTIRIESGILSSPLQFQSYPTEFVRIFIEPSLNVLGLNFNSNFLVSTEDKQLSNGMNMYSISIDRKSVQNKIIELTKSLDYYKQLDSLQDISKKLDLNKSIITSKHQSVTYQKELEIAKLTIEKSENDSTFYRSRKFDVLRSKRVLENYQKETRIVDSISNQIRQLNSSIAVIKNLAENVSKSNDLSYKKVDAFIKKRGNNYIQNKNDSISELSGMNKRIKKLSFLQNFRNIQIMDFNPNYSKLALNGISLRGLDLDWGNGSIYMSTSVGFLNSFKSSNRFIEAKENMITSRVGLGDQNKNYFGVFYMKAKYSDSSTSNQIKRIENDVLGIQLGFSITESHKISIEKLWSSLNTVKGSFVNNENLVNSMANGLNNGSLLITYNGFFSKTNTRVEGNFSSCQPFFYSIGNPFLWRDSRQYFLRIEEKLLKNNLTLVLAGKNTEDNISGLKSSSTKYLEYTLGFSYKIKKVFLKSEYRELKAENSSLGKINTLYLNTNTITWFNKLGSGHNSFVFNHNSILNVLMDQSFFNTQIFTIVNSIFLKGGTTLIINGSYRISTNSNEIVNDSNNSFVSGVNIQAKITKRVIGKMGYQFQKNLNYEIRNGINLGTVFNYSNRFQFSFLSQMQIIQLKGVFHGIQYSGNLNLVIKLFKQK